MPHSQRSRHRLQCRSPRWELLSIAFLVVALPRSAIASPQWHVGLVPGVGAQHDDLRTGAGFSGALNTDVLFAQQQAGDFGIGPSFEVATFAFRDVRLTPALTLALPVEPLALGFTCGPQLQTATVDTTIAIAGRGFLGIRTFNHSGLYSTAFGVTLGIDQRLTTPGSTWSVALHVDGMWMSLPAIAFVSWLRGSPHD